MTATQTLRRVDIVVAVRLQCCRYLGASRHAEVCRASRRSFGVEVMLWRLVLMAALVSGAQTAALAQAWPTRPVHVLVPQSAGGALDIVTRAVAEQLTIRLGQPMVVENRTGAGNTIAMAAV